MSLIDKLKNLINDMESSDGAENIDDVQIEAALEHALTEEKEEEQSFPKYLECTEEETSEYIKSVEDLKATKMRMSDLIVAYEKVKGEISVQLKEREHIIIAQLNSLREKYQVPHAGYLISLPSHQSEGRICFEKEEK